MSFRRSLLLLSICLVLPGSLLAQNPVPLVNQPILPASTTPGGPSFALTVNGTGFVPGATVNWNGAALPTHFVSGERLTASVPAIDIASPRTASISVANPGATVTSNVLFFSVASPVSTVNFSDTIGSPVNAAGSLFAFGDFNGNGKVDLVGFAPLFGLITLLGDGDGTFVASKVFGPAYPVAAATGDFNGDGKLDLAIAARADVVSDRFVACIWLGNGDGTFVPPDSCVDTGLRPTSVAVGDFNGDGKLDLAVTNSGDNNLTILLGNGDGTFTPAVLPPATGSFPISIVAGDFNGDGRLDLAVANDLSDNVTVLLGNGDGTFTPTSSSPATGPIPTAIAVGDFNADGKLDLAVTNNDGTLTILLGNGDGTFKPTSSSPATGPMPTAIAVGDFNADGKLDLAVAVGQGEDSGVAVLQGNGDGTFTSKSFLTAGGIEQGSLVAGDFNNDGRLDLAVSNYGSDGVSLLVLLQQSSVSFAPAVTLSTTLLSFPNQTVSTTSRAMIVTVRNTGNAALDLTATPSISGTNASDFAVTMGTTCTSGATVGTRSSCVIEVTFTPSAAASESAVLSIYDNAGNSPQAVGLNGTGVAPAAPPPTIISVLPADAVRGKFISTFTVTGNNFQPGASLSFTPSQGIAVGSPIPAFSNSGELTLSITIEPSTEAGARNVTVTNPDGQTSSPATFTVVQLGALPAPTGLGVIVGADSIYLRWDSYPFLADRFDVNVTTGLLSVPVGIFSCAASQGGTADSCLVDSSMISQALVPGQIYHLSVRAVLGSVTSAFSNTVTASPNTFSGVNTPPRQTPILFVHGFLENGLETGDAATWNDTIRFLTNTLKWRFGGELYHLATDLATTVRVDSQGKCSPPLLLPGISVLGTAGDVSGCIDDGDGAISPSADFFTVGFGNNVAQYTDSATTGLGRQGDELQAIIQQLLQSGVPAPYTIVAHSNGGLVARDYITRPLSDPRSLPPISKLVTYGTPHRGADVPSLVKNLRSAFGVISAVICGPFVDSECYSALSSYIDEKETTPGATDPAFACSPPAIVGGLVTYPSEFMKDLSTRIFPTGPTRYVSIEGISTVDYPFPPFNFGERPSDCLSATWDGLIPENSADLSKVENPPPSTSTRSFQTDRNHSEESTDFPAILCALDDNCLIFRVMSPVDIQVTAPNGWMIATNSVSIPGASYMRIPEGNGNYGATVLIPFPQGGAYEITATPQPGAQQTDTFTILQIQGATTTTIASNMPISGIPPSGFQAQVKSGTSLAVSVGGAVQQPLIRDGSGNFVATVTITNTGNVAIDSAQFNVSSTTLGTTALLSAPPPIVGLLSGASKTVTLRFPITSTLSKATSAGLKISGTYSAGKLSGNWSVTFRSVTLTH
jgi:hypothetical protein